MTPETRCLIINSICDKLYEATDTFEEIGMELSYLLWAIATDGDDSNALDLRDAPNSKLLALMEEHLHYTLKTLVNRGLVVLPGTP